MDTAAIIQRLRETNRAKVASDTGIPYKSLSNLVYGTVRNPSSLTIDKLRKYFEQGRPQ